jgi:hypothetical protein
MNGLTGESIYGTVIDQVARDAAVNALSLATTAKSSADIAITAVESGTVVDQLARDTALDAFSTATLAKSNADTALAAVETVNNGRFLKGTNTDFFNDGLIRLNWDGYDEIMIKHTTLGPVPTDIYAHATLVSTTSTVQFPSQNPMVVSTVDNDFAQSSGAMYVEFNIRSDSDSTFPYYEVKFQTTGSSGSTQAYWSVKKLT